MNNTYKLNKITEREKQKLINNGYLKSNIEHILDCIIEDIKKLRNEHIKINYTYILK